MFQLKADLTEVADSEVQGLEGNRDHWQLTSVVDNVATGASYFLCLLASAIRLGVRLGGDVAANGEGLALRGRLPSDSKGTVTGR